MSPKENDKQTEAMLDSWIKAAEHSPCRCEQCKEHQRWKAISDRGELAETRQLIEELSNALVEAQEELAMYQADRSERVS